jgi:hypothetical protein
MSEREERKREKRRGEEEMAGMMRVFYMIGRQLGLLISKARE